jgi:hypothetical protein
VKRRPGRAIGRRRISQPGDLRGNLAAMNGSTDRG